MTSSGNPITMDLKTRYVVKGIGKEQTIESIVAIHTNADGSKIVKVEDKWNGELPDSAIKNVSLAMYRLLGERQLLIQCAPRLSGD